MLGSVDQNESKGIEETMDKKEKYIYILTCFMRATANHVDYDDDNEQYRDHDANYGRARYQRCFVNLRTVWTLKDKKNTSEKISPVLT